MKDTYTKYGSRVEGKLVTGGIEVEFGINQTIGPSQNYSLLLDLLCIQ